MVVKHWSLTIREECRLRMFENRILKRTFRLKMDENLEWIRLRKEKLYGFYLLFNIFRMTKSRKLRSANQVARINEGRNAFKI